MNEAQTRFNKIDPKLRDAGWGIVPGSNILVEQSAYIAPGRLTASGNKNPKKADYILEYKGMKLAVIEAKSDEKDVSEGVAQAKLYADALKIRYTYSTNGDEIWFRYGCQVRQWRLYHPQQGTGYRQLPFATRLVADDFPRREPLAR